MNRKILICILVLRSIMEASATEKPHLIKLASLGSVNEGRIASYIDAEVRSAPKMQILFMFRETDGSLAHCCPTDIQIEPVERWSSLIQLGARAIAEPQGIIRMDPQVLQEDNAIVVGLEYPIVSTDYNNNAGWRFLLKGREYRIWCHEYGMYTQFTIPEDITSLRSLQLLWVVNEGTPLSKPEPKPKLGVAIPKSLRGSRFVIDYVVPYEEPIDEQWTSKEIENSSSVQMALQKPNGSLRIAEPGKMEVHALYIVESVTNYTINLPDDADYVYDPGNAVECVFELSGPPESYKVVDSIALYPSKDCYVPVIWHEIAEDDEEQSEFEETHSTKLKVCPGTYRAVILGQQRARHGEIMVEVKKDPKDNVFKVKISAEGEGLTVPRWLQGI